MIENLAALRAHRPEIIEIARRHGAVNIEVFGSFARGDMRDDSAVDLLITVGASVSSWFPGGLLADLEELLGRPVRVVTREGLNPLLKDRVLAEAIPLAQINGQAGTATP